MFSFDPLSAIITIIVILTIFIFLIKKELSQ